jgi:predicted RecA/RadA family phage recombinase
MATNFVQPGQVLTLTAPSGGVTSGSGYLIGAMFVVALHSAVAGESFEGQLTGVWSLPKTSAQAWTEGAALYWDGSKVTTAESTNALIGHAASSAANPSATGLVRLSA